MTRRRYRINFKQWKYGRLQWGHEINILTAEAEKELRELKKQNPDVDFEKLAEDVREGRLKPV